jgi:hypothetical protein
MDRESIMTTADQLDGAIDSARMALLARAPARPPTQTKNRVDTIPYFSTPENTPERATGCPTVRCVTVGQDMTLEPSARFLRPPLSLPRFNATLPQTENEFL